jgi:hypothetical protein
LAKGLWSGVTGIITQPVKGAKKKGAIGFAKGIGRGVLGVAVRPVTGNQISKKNPQFIEIELISFDFV